MAMPEHINDKNEAASCIDGVAQAQAEPLAQLEITVQQGDAPSTDNSSENLVDTSAPEEKGDAESLSQAKFEIQIPDTNLISESEEATYASAYRLSSSKIHETGTVLRSPLHQNHLIPQTRESEETAPPGSIEEPHNVEDINSPAVINDTADQLGQKCVLKDIVVGYAEPHSLGDVLTLNVMRDDGSDQLLHLARMSDTKWKAAENIECDHNCGNMMLVASSMEQGDEGFLTLTEDEMHAMEYEEEDTPVEHVFASLREDYQVHIKISATIVSSLAHSQRGTCLTELQQRLRLRALETLDSIEEFRRRFDETGDIEDIDQVIFHLEEMIPLASGLPGSENNRFISLFFGTAYSKRFGVTGNLADIDCAISHQQDTVDSTLPGHVDLPLRLGKLGDSYLTRFECTGNLDDIKYAIGYLQKAVDSTPFDHADLPMLLNTLGTSYTTRFERTGNLDDIDCAMSHHQNAVDSTPPGHADLSGRLNNLGNSYSLRFGHTGNLDDIDCGISHQRNAVASTPIGHASLPMRLHNLGTSYSARFKRTGNLDDINYAILYHQQAVDSTPSRHADLPLWLNSLGSSYSGRFEHTGNLDDIDCAISHQQNAIYSTPSGHIDLPTWVSNLGNSYSRRFGHTKNLDDINRAIYHKQKAVDSTPSDHVNLTTFLQNLGSSYLGRFQLTWNLDDIDCAICHLHKAVFSTPSDHADLLVDSAPSDHADLPSWLSSLGDSYAVRFERTGNLDDIDCAISHHQKAVYSTPSGHIDIPGRLNSLACSYLSRFNRTRSLDDINYAISHQQKSVDSAPSGHYNLPNSLTNLGSSYLGRFNLTRNLADIKCAISHHQKAVDSALSGHADLTTFFHNLGNSYTTCFALTGNLDDIDCAISYHDKAVDSISPGHASFPERLSNLGCSYFGRFKHTGNLADIDCAISHQKKAVDSTPVGHAALPLRLIRLGYSYATRFSCNNNEIDVKRAITSYRHGAQSNGPPSIRLESANAAALHSVFYDVSQCLLDFGLAIGIFSEVAGLEQTIHRRYDNLHDHSDLVGNAVAKAVLLNRPDLALEWLEEGRCLVWNQLHQLRTPIDSLHTINPSLADQFISVASALEYYGSRSITPHRTADGDLKNEIRLQNDTQKHTLHAIQYNKLLDEIRALVGFKDFLRPPKTIELLASLPTDGPVIVFNIHKSRCDALALISGIQDPLCIPLDNFSLDMAKQLLNTLRFYILKNREVDDQDHRLPERVKSSPASMSYILKQLWCNVVQPVLEALGYSHDLLVLRRRIWWCPSGPLAFLPLHAAGIYRSEYKPGSCISDYAVSSYTPTVRSLNEKFAASAFPAQSDILIINPNTPGLPPIPFTATESHGIKELFGESALLLEDAAASTDTVKKELGKHNWVHFACHGIQDLQDPLKSGVHLFDGRLELLDIMHQKLSNADFAFLSACQTSKGDIKLSEEVVHIAAGMLAAGYRGVVGTMWSISDQHGPQFAKHFYEYLFKEKISEDLDSTKGAYALDYATRKVRETLGEGDDAFLIWVPYVHFGY